MRRRSQLVTVMITRRSSESVPSPIWSGPYGTWNGTTTSSGSICAVLSSSSATTCPAPRGIQSHVVQSWSARSGRFFASQSSTEVRSAIPDRIAMQRAAYDAIPVVRATSQMKSCGSILVRLSRGLGVEPPTSGDVRERDRRQRRGLDAGLEVEEGCGRGGRSRAVAAHADERRQRCRGDPGGGCEGGGAPINWRLQRRRRVLEMQLRVVVRARDDEERDAKRPELEGPGRHR